MRISFTKENLIHALSMVSGVTGKNINLPILNNILIKAEGNKVEISATNLEQAVVVTVRAKIEEAGSFTVPARTVLDVVSLFNGDTINFSIKENELIVTCGKTSSKIKGVSAEEFPVIPTFPEGKGFLVPAAELKGGLLSVLSSAAKNDIRPELAGIFCGFDSKNKSLTLAATDSYRLAEKKIKLEQGEGEEKIIIPARAAQEISHILTEGKEENKEKSARIMMGDNQIMVVYNNAQVISRLVEGQYPDYTQIIPKDFITTVTTDTEKFIKEMKGAGLFTTSGVNSVTLKIDAKSGIMEVSSTSNQTGEYRSELPVEVKGEDNLVLINNRYVLDGMNNMNSTELQIKIINGDTACVFTPKGSNDYLYIVMPIRQ